jgi:hypothetical protein
MPVILATQEAEIRRTMVQSQAGQIVHETLSQKYLTPKGLVEWLYQVVVSLSSKHEALSSNSSTTKVNK